MTQAKIKHSHKKYTDYLTNENLDTFFLSPTKKEEIIFIILSSLDINKSSGPYSIPSKVLNMFKYDISEQLADFFNLSFTTGNFPISCGLETLMQALKFCALAIMIYRYCNFDLGVTTAEIVQNFS